MWPFDKKVVKPVIVTRPMPECGDLEHYEWVDEGWRCPICAANEIRSVMNEEQEELAELIATKVASKLTTKSDN